MPGRAAAPRRPEPGAAARAGRAGRAAGVPELQGPCGTNSSGFPSFPSLQPCSAAQVCTAALGAESESCDLFWPKLWKGLRAAGSVSVARFLLFLCVFMCLDTDLFLPLLACWSKDCACARNDRNIFVELRKESWHGRLHKKQVKFLSLSFF